MIDLRMTTREKIKKFKGENLSYAEIGRRTGVSRQRIFQIITGYRSPYQIKRRYSTIPKKLKEQIEKRLGRKLRLGEVVHHINGIRSDNRLRNLYVMTNQSHAIYEGNLTRTYRRWIQEDYNLEK